MKDYWKHVASYLTGWCIAQPLYNLLRKRATHREMVRPSIETRSWWDWQAVAIADELESRRKSDLDHDHDEDHEAGLYLIHQRTAQVVLHHIMGDSHLDSPDELDAAIKSLQIITGDA